MSRIGNKVIVIPAGVSVEVNGATVTVKGPKGELVRSFNENITLEIAENEITVKRPNDTKEMKMLHGTTRALLANMVEGVSNGFSKALEMIGVGYRAQLIRFVRDHFFCFLPCLITPFLRISIQLHELL